MANPPRNSGESLIGTAATQPEAPRRIDLAHEPPIRLGPLVIEPPLRRIVHDDGREEIVEPRVMEVLVALIRADGTILSRDDLAFCCWDKRIVGDDAINRVLSRLRRTASGIGKGAFRIETLTKVGYRLVRGDGMRGGIAAAWPPPRPARRRIGTRAAAAFAAIALVALGLVAWAVFRGGAGVTDRPVIAVIPFEDVSPGGRNAFFAEGVSEEILNTLARDGRFRVLGRTTSWALRERAGDLDFLRGRLQVGHLLEGSVRSVGNRVRISVRLVSTDDGREVWTEVFDRRIGDIFALQDEIAREVGLQLAGSLAPPGPRPTPRTSPEIYRDYLLARQLIRARTWSSIARARALMESAVRADPGYAPAWATYSYALSLASEVGGYGNEPNATALELAKSAARRALALEPDWAEAHLAMGAAAVLEGDLPAARDSLERAVALDPQSATVRLFLAHYYSAVPDVNRAIAQLERASDLDPLWRLPLGFRIALYELRNDEQAISRLVADYRGIATVPGEVRQLEMREAYYRGDFARALGLMRSNRESGLDETRTPFNTRFPWAALYAFDRIAADAAAARELEPLSYAYLAGRPDLAVGRALEGGQAVWRDAKLQMIATWALLATGRDSELSELFVAHYRQNADFALPMIGTSAPAGRWPSAAVRISYALDSQGQTMRARELRAMAARGMRRFETNGMAASENAVSWAELHLAEGNRTAALQALEGGVAGDWQDVCAGPIWIGSWRLFRPLRGDRRFEAVLERCRSQVDRQRRQLGLASANLP